MFFFFSLLLKEDNGNWWRTGQLVSDEFTLGVS